MACSGHTLAPLPGLGLGNRFPLPFPSQLRKPSRRPRQPSRPTLPQPGQPFQPGPKPARKAPCPFSPSASPRAVKTSEGDGLEASRRPKKKQSFFP